MKNYWVNNSLEIIKIYLDNSLKNTEMFEQFIFTEIINFKQFEFVNKIIKFYNLIPLDNYI
uniref:Uncharacterized protein n=1 Tax=viral metagenome TaxID=1070528 RepID=A0A6C0AE02_9ZZZZ